MPAKQNKERIFRDAHDGLGAVEGDRTSSQHPHSYERLFQWVEPMADAGVNQYTFHIEPVKEVISLCRKIREAGMQVGLALKPGTGIEAVRQYIDHADMILIMTVEPGFGGQKFMSDMMPKVQWLRHNYPGLDIEVDGGVGLNTINACAEVRIVYRVDI
jgi:ribulose-phosphate 3-epimerase